MSRKAKVVAGAAAGLAVAAGGGALAATQLDSPKAENQAIVNDAAQQLGIEPSKLTSALQKALEDRVDAAVAAGRLTQAQGNALKARIESGDVPLFAPTGGPGPHFGGPHGPGFGGFDAAASYLGLTEAELRTQLESGKTLADVAKAQGKTADGLIQALYDDAKTHLDAARAAGRITQAEEDQALADLKQRITDQVNGTAPRFFGRRGFVPGPALSRMAVPAGPYA
jgi:hypothetical protein